MFEEVICFILENEGGYYTGDSLHTNFGIAFEYNKKVLKEHGITQPDQMKTMHPEVAYEIYKVKYWGRSKSCFLPDKLVKTHFDFYINKPTLAMKALQLTCNRVLGSGLVVDGAIGTLSKKALTVLCAFDKMDLVIDCYNMFRLRSYVELLKNARNTHGDKKAVDFILSWTERVNKLYR